VIKGLIDGALRKKSFVDAQTLKSGLTAINAVGGGHV
jgi:hypothetical protein